MPDPTEGRIQTVTVQKLPPSQPRPKKRLSHTVKARPSSGSSGAVVPIFLRKKFGKRNG